MSVEFLHRSPSPGIKPSTGLTQPHQPTIILLSTFSLVLSLAVSSASVLYEDKVPGSLCLLSPSDKLQISHYGFHRLWCLRHSSLLLLWNMSCSQLAPLTYIFSFCTCQFFTDTWIEILCVCYQVSRHTSGTWMNVHHNQIKRKAIWQCQIQIISRKSRIQRKRSA